MPARAAKGTLKSQKPRKPVPTKVLLSWKAPARPFKKRDREYFTTIGAIVFLVAVILVFLKEWLLIAVVVSLMFVAYVLATVPPEIVEHTITNKGVETGGKLYKWEELKRFWFSKKWKDTVLNIETEKSFPGRLLLVVPEVERKRVEETLAKYLEMEAPEPTFMDKAAKWLSEKVPLESE